MEERSKTIMCSVLFLDIVEYSKKSVSGQISLKERFNDFLSVAIRDVPLDDRIILDTGDGAALSFLGDVEDALQVALVLRESLRSENAHMDPALLVRMGINLGPVRLVKDINGQPNIVGDGINVAQRIMGFSDPGQVLVSRSYYDAVSRLSPEYTEMFHFEGSRTDKHVREHEVYAIGYPGEFSEQKSIADKTTAKFKALQKRIGSSWQVFAQRVSGTWQSTAQRLGKIIQAGIAAYQAATPGKRAAYVGGVVAFFALIAVTEVMIHRTPKSDTPLVEATAQSATDETAADTGEKTSADQQQEEMAETKTTTSTSKTAPATRKKESGSRTSTSSSRTQPSTSTAQPKSATKSNETIFGIPIPPKGKPGYASITCMDGSSVFVDGFSKGTIGSRALRISLDPGKHHLTITHASKPSVYTQVIVIKSGQTLYLHPSFCN
jgi:Adenylate and Guanylate cyclase catalytic domain